MKTLNEIKEKLARSMTFQGHNQTENKFDTMEINRIVRALDLAIDQRNRYLANYMGDSDSGYVPQLTEKANSYIEKILSGEE